MNLIIGNEGYIANKLLARKEYNYTTLDKNDKNGFFLDLNYPQDFDFSIIDYKTTIIFLAAISSPDECNNNFEFAYKINVTGSIYFIQEAIKRGAKVLFFASDVIYGNTNVEVDEHSMTNPFGKYALMKDVVEKYFLNESLFKVFRLSYVLSNEDKFVSYLKMCSEKSNKAEIFHPFYRKVVFIDDVLESIENIVIKWNDFDNQKFNICGIEDISRLDIANLYNEATGLNLELEINDPGEGFWKARPKDINVTSKYVEKLLGRKQTKISDAINSMFKGVK